MNSIVSFLRDTKSIGELSELVVALSLSRAGYLVSKPLGENARYDLVIERGGNLSRVQVKTGRFRYGAVEWNCCSTHAHRNGPNARPYFGEVEYFGVYCPQLESAYLVPIADTARRCTSLRVQTTKNRQSRRIRWASDYLISAEPIPQLILVGSDEVDVVTEPHPPAPS